MAVRLKKRAKTPKRPRLSRELERAFLAILMHFPPRDSRDLASDLMCGDAPITPANLKKLIKAVDSYDVDDLERVDPAFRVCHARDALKRHIGMSVSAPARVRKKRVVSRLTKCR
jgi:hypothetical protein